MRIFNGKQRYALFVIGLALSWGFAFTRESALSGKEFAGRDPSLPELTDTSKATPVDSLPRRTWSTGYSLHHLQVTASAVVIAEPSMLTVIPSGNIPNQLQGRLTGLSVIGNGQPGSISRVRIRGFSSFWSNDPLYVVDGVPTLDISALNPHDVETLCVLKDAGAAAVYGSRASNGVIVITTRKGDRGIRVTYGMYAGVQSPGKGPDNLLNTEEYADLQWLVYANDGTVETHPIYGPSTSPSPSLPAWAANTNWYDMITDRAGIQNHDLALSGGTDKGRYFAALGYFRQDGIIIHTYSERFNARFNSEWDMMNDRLKFGENFYLAYRSNLHVPNLSEGSPVQKGPYRSQSIIPAIITVPVEGMSHSFVAGEYGGTGIAPRLGSTTNAFADLTRAKDNKYHDISLIGNAYLDLTIMEGLNFRSSIGGTWNNGYNTTYISATYENAQNIVTPSFSEGGYYGNDWVWTNTLAFDKAFGNHKLLAVAGYEAVKYGIGRAMSGARSGYFSDDVDFRTLTNGATITGASSNSNTPTRMISMFVKADYALLNRYLLGVSVRRDGCSRFGENNRYGVFPAFSAGWRISEEGFMENLRLLSELKIRGSWGTMGNQYAISPQYQYYQFSGHVASSYYDLNGTGNSAVLGYYPIYIGNPDIRWETNTTTNIGIEAGMWNNTLGITMDWYQKKSEDLLYNIEMPATAGGTEQTWINSAAMKNSGVELEMSYNNTWGDVGLNTSLIITTYRNEITAIADGVDFFDAGSTDLYLYYGAVCRNEKGHPLSSFYGYQVTGLFQNDQEVQNAPYQDGAEPGFFRYANNNTTDNYGGDYQHITPLDKTFIGNPNPKFTYGLNLSATWKRFDLNAFIYGSRGNDILNWNKWYTDFWSSFQGQKSTDLLYNSWTPGNTGASVPKASNRSNFSTNTQLNSYLIEDGSYLRLKSLQLGFTLPEQLLNKAGIQSLRLYLQGVNLFTITGYTGLDPEIGGEDTAFGIDRGNYPGVKQFIFGFNVTL